MKVFLKCFNFFFFLGRETVSEWWRHLQKSRRKSCW